MRIAVLGGSGRIGAAVVRRAAEKGHDVLNLDRRRPPKDAPGRFYYTDMSRRDVLDPRLSDFAPEAVCHLAEIPNVMAGESPEHVFASNCATTSTVAQTIADLGVPRLIYASTCQVYGLWGNPETAQRLVPAYLPMDEDHPVRPRNMYAAGKVACEAMLRSVADMSPVAISALRLPHTADFGGDERWTRWVRRTPAGPLHEMGTFLDVTDAAEAFVLLAEAPVEKLGGYRVYNVANEEVMHGPDWPTVAQRAAEHHPNWPALPAEWPAQRALLSTERLRRDTGWYASLRLPPIGGD